MNVGRLGAGRAAYYLSQVADGVEDYYTERGEADVDPVVVVGSGRVGL